MLRHWRNFSQCPFAYRLKSFNVWHPFMIDKIIIFLRLGERFLRFINVILVSSCITGSLLGTLEAFNGILDTKQTK